MAGLRDNGLRVTDLAAAFGAAGAQVAVSDDIIGAMWAKWVFIASVGAAAAAGHPAPVDVLRATEQALTTPGSPATSSLSRDLSMNRPTEVGAVLADLPPSGPEALSTARDRSGY